jgi:hypothetical protein
MDELIATVENVRVKPYVLRVGDIGVQGRRLAVGNVAKLETNRS